MSRLSRFQREAASQILRVQALSSSDFATLFDSTLLRCTRTSELISVDTVHGDALTELTNSVAVPKPGQILPFLDEIKKLNGGNKVGFITGYNSTDL